MNKNKALKQLRELKKLKGDFRLAAEGWNKDWKTLIATLLSARTRDEKTIEVCKKLFKTYKTPKALGNGKLSDIEKQIKQINFYKTKSKNIIACAKALDKEYRGRVPYDFEKLIKLPGVGRKTANVFLAEQGKPTIGVDTHTSDISQKLSWTKNQKPEKIEQDLKKLFPKNRYKDINPILVGFGRKYRGKKRIEILKEIKKL